MQLLMAQIFIFAVFAMSYDLLLGYTGIVSFGHAMFFGIGAYTTGIFLERFGSNLVMLILSLFAAAFLSALVSYFVGMLSLRLKSHYYAMLTLAFAQLFLVGAQKWRSLTSGNDGFTFILPTWLMNQTTFYFIALGFMFLVYLVLNRFTTSPLGSVLQAIRENEKRVESLGYKILHYKVLASIFAGVLAGLSGAMYAYTLRFVSTSVFAIDKTLDVLLMTIIGGVGTLVGAMVGAGIIELAHHYLSQLADQFWLFKRWMILFGMIYILAVIFFPYGIVGSLYKRSDRHRKRSASHVGSSEERDQSSKGA